MCRICVSVNLIHYGFLCVFAYHRSECVRVCICVSMYQSALACMCMHAPKTHSARIRSRGARGTFQCPTILLPRARTHQHTCFLAGAGALGLLVPLFTVPTEPRLHDDVDLNLVVAGAGLAVQLNAVVQGRTAVVLALAVGVLFGEAGGIVVPRVTRPTGLRRTL